MAFVNFSRTFSPQFIEYVYGSGPSGVFLKVLPWSYVLRTSFYQRFLFLRNNCGLLSTTPFSIFFFVYLLYLESGFNLTVNQEIDLGSIIK